MSNNLQSGLEKVKGALGGLIEPALIFAATGSKSAAIWGGLKAVLIAKVFGPLSLISGLLVGMIGTLKLLIGQSEMLGKGMNKLRSLETIKTQFQPLLGGAEMAQARLKELYDFAASTPFQMEEIAEASKTLEILTRGALSTGEGLRMVGDAAAVAGQSMQSVAFHVGRLYDGLQSGAPIGEASMRLQEMGLISGEARRKIEASRQAGDSFVETFKIFEEEMEKTKGGMEELSQTLGGLESTLADVRAGFQAKFAENFMEAEKASVKTMITLFEIFEKPIARIGYYFSRVATFVQELFGGFVEFAGGAKTLGNTLTYLVDAFAALVAAVMGVQLATVIAGMTGLAKATGVATAASKASALVAIFNQNAHLGLTARLKLCGNEWLTYTAKQKAAAIGGLFAGGVFKVLGVIFGMLKGAINAATAAILKNPWAFALAAVITLVMAVSRFNSNIEEQEKRIEKLRKKHKELADQLDKTISSIDTFDKKLAAQTEIEGKLDAAIKEMEEFKEEMESVGILGRAMGEQAKMAETFKTQQEQVDQLAQKLRDVVSIEAESLAMGKIKADQLKEEIQLREQLRGLEMSRQEEGATDAEKITLNVERRLALETKLGRAEETRAGDKKREDLTRGEGDFKDVSAIREKVAEGKAMQEEAEGIKNQVDGIVDNLSIWQAGQATGWTDGFTGTSDDVSRLNALVEQMNNMHAEAEELRGVEWSTEPMEKWVQDGEGSVSDFLEWTRKVQEQAFNLRTAGSGVEGDALEELREKTEDATGVNMITPEIIKNLGNLDEYTGQDIGVKGTPMGLKVALQERLKKSNVVSDEAQVGKVDDAGAVNITGKQKQMMEEAIEFLKQEEEKYQDMILQIQEIVNEREAMLRPMRMAIELLEIEKGLHGEMMKLSQATYENQLKGAQAEMEAAEKRLDTVKRLSDESQSLEDMQKKLAWVEGEGKMRVSTDKDGNPIFKTFEQDQRDQGVNTDEGIKANKEEMVKNLKEMIEMQKKSNEETFAAEKALEEAEKRLRDLHIDKARQLRDIFAEIKKLGTELSLDMNLDNADFDKAHDDMVSLIAQEDNIWRRKRIESLRASGLFSEGLIKKIIEKEEKNRDAQQEAGRRKRELSVGVGELQFDPRNNVRGPEGTGAFQKARLDMFARVFGDSKARQKSEDITNREFFRDQLRENIKLGFGKEESVNLAKTALDTKLMGEVQAAKVTTDSFRKVGAGGYATATDPMRKLAEKRNRALEAIRDDIRKLVPINEEIAKKDLEPKVG